MRRIGSVAGLLVLSACGGGGGDGGGSQPVTVTPAPTLSTLSVTLSPAAQTATATEQASGAAFSFTATAAGTPSGAVYPDVQYDKTLLTLDGAVAASGNGYTARFTTPDTLGAGHRTGSVTFRLCADTGCAKVYPGSTQFFAYTLDVPLDDWQGQQRTAAHTGYIHATLDQAMFKQAWQWMPTAASGVSAIASKGGSLFVTQRNSDWSSSVVALSTASGTQQWRYDLGAVSSASGPSMAGDRLFVSTIGNDESDNKVFALDATKGANVEYMPFYSQWAALSPPTPFGDSLYLSAGYYGGEVYSFAMASGEKRWSAYGAGSNIWDNETPAVDDKYVYYYSGASLDLFDRATGTLVKSLPDQNFAWGGYSYHGAPMLGDGTVVAYSGSYTGDYPAPKPLVGYDLSAGAAGWRSSSVYVTTPALAKHVVYAARNDPARLDALDEKTGAVLWSWTPPQNEKFIGNSVVADNMLFVSTDAHVYALGLTGAPTAPLWSAGTPGLLAVTADGTLVVAVQPTPNVYSYSYLVGYRLW